MADADEVGPAQDRRGPGWSAANLLPCLQVAQEALPGDGEVGIRGDRVCPGVGQLAGDRHQRPPRRGEPRLGHRRHRRAAPRSSRTSASVPWASRGCGRSGPLSSGTSSRSTPAWRSMSSSLAVAAVESTPTIAAVRSPSRAVVSEAYVTPPPSRQPRGSSGTTSRHAEPTWTTSTPGRAMAPPTVYCRLAPTARGHRRVLLRAT